MHMDWRSMPMVLAWLVTLATAGAAQAPDGTDDEPGATERSVAQELDGEEGWSNATGAEPRADPGQF